MMNRSILLPVLLVALAQAGCMSDTFQPAVVGLSPAAAQVDAALPPASRSAAAALPMAAGHVVAVRTMQAGDSVSQDIVLNSGSRLPGENAIHITVSRSPATGRVGGPTEDDIAMELAAAFPGVRM